MKLHGLDLFSGIGGISYGLSRWVRPVCYCEIEPFSQRVLQARMESGDLPEAPIWNDVTTLTSEVLESAGIARPEIIYGGFPCTDISVAGKQAGITGKQSGLFSEIIRLADEIRPRYIFLENVAAIVNRGMGTVLAALAEIGYDASWMCLSAAEVGAPHKRDRWWCLATNSDQLHSQRTGAISEPAGWNESSDSGTDPHTGSDERCEEYDIAAGSRESGQCPWPSGPIRDYWQVVAEVDRISHGVPSKLDRSEEIGSIRALGNAVVPQCVEAAFELLYSEGLI